MKTEARWNIVCLLLVRIVIGGDCTRWVCAEVAYEEDGVGCNCSLCIGVEVANEDGVGCRLQPVYLCRSCK